MKIPYFKVVKLTQLNLLIKIQNYFPFTFKRGGLIFFK